MSILDHLNPIGSAIEKTGGALDELFTSDEERLLARIELEKLKLEFQRAVDSARLEYESELTKRHAADMASDNGFSKRIRPASLVFLLALVSGLSIADGNIVISGKVFEIGESWISLLETLATAAFVFYFGGKSFERIKK